MASAVEMAVEKYIRAACERDPALRAALLEECFAEDGRMVTSHREIRGRAAIASMLDRAHADPKLRAIRVLGEVDAKGTIFRYRAVTEHHDGATFEVFDAGEIDESGRISLILTFAGPTP